MQDFFFGVTPDPSERRHQGRALQKTNEVKVGQEAAALRKLFASVKQTMMEAELLLERLDGGPKPMSPRNKLLAAARKSLSTKPATVVQSDTVDESKPASAKEEDLKEAQSAEASSTEANSSSAEASVEMVEIGEKA